MAGGVERVNRVGMVALDALLSGSREFELAAVTHLSRYRGTPREHTESNLRIFFPWCQERQLAPLDAQRNDLELYLRWMQDVRRFKPSTVSRRLSVVAGFYRTCVIDGTLEHSPADDVRRPTVPPESPTLGLTHLQLEALLTTAGSPATRSTSSWCASSDCSASAQPARYAHGPARRDPTAASPGGRRRRQTAADAPAHAAAHLRHTMLDAGVDLRDDQIAARHADPRTTMRYDQARKNLDRHPNYILAPYMASDT